MGQDSPSFRSKLAATLQLPYASERTRPAGLKWRSNTIFILATVTIGMFVDLYLYGLIIPILPYLLEDRLGVPPSQIQDHVSGLLAVYAASSVLFSPVAGWMADKSSARRLPFLVGLVAMLLGTILLYVGDSVPALVVARVLQGVAAGVVWTIALALCIDTVGSERLGTTVGTVFSFVTVGELLAPITGGVLYAKVGYGSVFVLGGALLGVDFLMRLLIIEKKIAARYEDGEDHSEDANENESQTQNQDEEPNEETALLNRTKAAYRMDTTQVKSSLVGRVPILYCFRDPALLAAMLVSFLQASLIASFESTVVTEAKDLFGFDSLKAGLLFIPISAMNLVLGPVAGWTVDKYGTRRVAVIGYTFLVPVLISLRTVEMDGPNQLILYIVLLSLCGIGLATIGAPALVESGIVVENYHKANPDLFGANGPYASLYGVNNMVFSLGLAVGPVVAGGLRETIGYGNMNAVLAGMCAFTAIVCFMYLGRRPTVDTDDEDEEE